MYIENSSASVKSMSDERKRRELATIAWEGDSREVLRDFPEGAKEALGFQLWQLQQGERPSDYRPLSSVGMGVFELRERDERGWYRVVYLSRIDDVIHVLHCFEKKSREMPRKDFEKARQRLKAVQARLAEEKKKYEKHNE
jgi:phage-related protein